MSHFKLLPIVVPIVLLLAGCATTQITSDDRATIAKAETLHQVLSPAIIPDTDTQLHKYLSLIAARIRAGGKQADADHLGPPSHFDQPSGWMYSDQVKFVLIKHDQPNAFAAGESVYFTQGLMQSCRDEDELASMLCRAYAHLYSRDVARTFAWPANPDRTELLRVLVNYQYTPVQRTTAEATAFAIYTRGGWDPAKFDAFNQRQASSTTDPAQRAAILSRLAEDHHRLEAMPASARDWRQPPIADARHFAVQQTMARALAASVSMSDDAQMVVAALPDGVLAVESPQRQAARQRLAPPPVAPVQNEWGKGMAPR